jgi:hypothetical protein
MTGAEPISDVDLATAAAPLAVEALEAAAPLVAPLAQSVSMIAAAPMADLAGEVHVFLSSVRDLLAKYSLPFFVPMHFSSKGIPRNKGLQCCRSLVGVANFKGPYYHRHGRLGHDVYCVLSRNGTCHSSLPEPRPAD